LVRLTKYHELNTIRVVFRFLFTVPLVILGADGVRPHQHVNDKMFPTDLLGILAGIGCVVSSGITLVIFFPRSIEGEMTLKAQQRTRRRRRSLACLNRTDATDARASSDVQPYISVTQQSKTDLAHSDAPPKKADLSMAGPPAYEVAAEHERLPSIKKALEDERTGYLGGTLKLKPNRRNTAGIVELGAVLTDSEVELARARTKRDESVNSLVHHWRSPIEIGRPTVSRWQRQV